MMYMIILMSSAQIHQDEKSTDLSGCSLSRRYRWRWVFDDIDLCPDTPENYPLLTADGCTDESAKNVDWDEDGYTGDDDEFMFEPTQWCRFRW